MVRVALVRCPDYDDRNVGPAVDRALGLLGGWEAFVPRRARVFVKINHLSPPSPPGQGIITHPAVAAAVIARLKEFEAEVIVGDDIQSPETDGFSVSGYREVCRRLGVGLINLKEDGFREVGLQGARLRSVYFARQALDSDLIVNLPKLKTHAFTAFTGAVKNMFGCIPYGARLEAHRRFPRQDDFSEMLADLYAHRPPRLTVMDGIVAMEGEGPAGGPLRKVGLLLAGGDGVAVDAVAARLIGFKPGEVLTTAFAQDRGAGVGDPAGIEVVGERPENAAPAVFKHSALAMGLLRKKLPQAIYAFISGQLVLIPEIVPVPCTGCWECVKICPTGAARREGSKARISGPDCIHCMCCHEVCRFQAVRTRSTPLGRWIKAGGKIARRLGVRL